MPEGSKNVNLNINEKNSIASIKNKILYGLCYIFQKIKKKEGEKIKEKNNDFNDKIEQSKDKEFRPLSSLCEKIAAEREAARNYRFKRLH